MTGTIGWLARAARRWPGFAVPLLLGWLIVFGAATAQPSQTAPAAQDGATQRQRIALERAAAEGAWAEGRVGCKDRFAVTGCINAADAAYRQKIEALDRELDRLDTAQRRARAAERLEIIRSKTEALEAAALAAAEAAAVAPAEAPPEQTAPPDVPAAPGAESAPAVRDADEEIARRRAEAARSAAERAEASRQRRDEAARRRDEREQRRSEGEGQAAPALPLPGAPLAR